MISNIGAVQSYMPYSAFIICCDQCALYAAINVLLICCDQCAVENKQRRMLELINRLANEFKVFIRVVFAVCGNFKGSHDAISQIPKNFILKEIRADRENNELILDATSAWDCCISRLPQPKPKSKEENRPFTIARFNFQLIIDKRVLIS